MAAQAAPIETGAVYLPTTAPWLGEFRKEILSFLAVNTTTKSTPGPKGCTVRRPLIS